MRDKVTTFNKSIISTVEKNTKEPRHYYSIQKGSAQHIVLLQILRKKENTYTELVTTNTIVSTSSKYNIIKNYVVIGLLTKRLCECKSNSFYVRDDKKLAKYLETHRMPDY